MKKPTMKQLTSWSFSRYSVYKECPLKAKLKFIDKLPEPGNAAMERGNLIHKEAESYIKGELRNLPNTLAKFKDLFRQLKAHYKKLTTMVVEDTWAFTATWTQTQWNDWAGCAVRIKTDCAWITKRKDGLVMEVVDWKTGKFRAEKNEEYLEQLELYALAALILNHDLDAVEPRLVYLDLEVVFPPEDEPIRYTHADVPRLKQLWAARVKPMLTDTKFQARPNNNCRFCHYRKSNGGPCKY